MADDRLTLRQAAARLGVSESAIRKRVERGTLRSEKGQDGRRYVYVDTVADIGADPSATHERDVLISRLEDEVAYLREESRRKDEIIMQQAMTMRQLTAPAAEPREEPPQSPVSPGPSDTSTDVVSGPETEVDEQQGRGPVPDTPGPQEPAEQPRSWWRRLLEG